MKSYTVLALRRTDKSVVYRVGVAENKAFGTSWNDMKLSVKFVSFAVYDKKLIGIGKDENLYLISELEIGKNLVYLFTPLHFVKLSSIHCAIALSELHIEKLTFTSNTYLHNYMLQL